MNDDLPIVATNVGDNYKLVRDRANGYLETMGDVDALAKAIVTLYCDSFKFRKLNQRISASVQGTPRRGNEHIAQGIALGMMKR